MTTDKELLEKAARAALPAERTCCGTFPRTPHRCTCANYRGKFRAAAAQGEKR